MLLQRLSEYADRIPDRLPTFYARRAVRYVIELDAVRGPSDAYLQDMADPSIRELKRGRSWPVPHVVSTSGIRPFLFAHNAAYTLGRKPDESKAIRVRDSHAAYIELVRRCAEATRDSAVSTVLDFLMSEYVDTLILPDDFDFTALMTFRVDGHILPIELPGVRKFWADVNDPDADLDKPAPVMQCIVCGEPKPVLERLKGSIKGVPGAATGAAIISANEDAFLSYGLKASLIAPICADDAGRFTTAANWLLASSQNCIRINDAAFIFWTREPVDFDFTEPLERPNDTNVQAIFGSIWDGDPSWQVETTAFYATVFSASKGRIVVRDWIDTTVGTVKRKLADWFRYQCIVDYAGEGRRYFGVRMLAEAMVRNPRDVTARSYRTLLRCALAGTPVPMEFLEATIRRTVAAQEITPVQAALVKLVLSGNEAEDQTTEIQEGTMVHLEPHHPNAAYHCGRLLSVLEYVQRRALGEVNAGVVERFYGSASSTPASVFGMIIDLTHKHLKVIAGDNPGAFNALQDRIQGILGEIADFPLTLTPRERGLFALGFYHQRAHDIAQGRAAGGRRKQSGSLSTVDTIEGDEEAEATEETN